MDDTPQRIEIIYDIILGPTYRLHHQMTPQPRSSAKSIQPRQGTKEKLMGNADK